MDVKFNPVQWQPSKPPEPGDTILSTAYISYLSDRLRERTQAILRYPYDPIFWLRRSSTLSRLRYPELAVGDAYKATMLCQAHHAQLASNDGWRMGHRMGFWMQDDLTEDSERAQTLINYLQTLQDCATDRIGEQTELFVDNPQGEFKRRAYPWMADHHRRRSDRLILSINEEFAARPPSGTVGPACLVKRHAFGGGEATRETADVLGVFAAHDIQKGDTVLEDQSRTWGCNGPGIHGDYENLHGGRGCSDPLHPNSESDDVDLDLRWIRDRLGKHSSCVIRNAKLLLCSIQDGYEHPLDHPLIARITPTYPKDIISKFSLDLDIGILNEALQQFGVDIFANHNYDTWVLFTIEARARNNSCGDPAVDLLCPLFSLFNHSCAPNVHWRVAEDHQSITATAHKDIRQGEQMFVMYDVYVEDQPLDKRRQALWRWLDGPCQCGRCVQEERKYSIVGKPPVEERKNEWDLKDKPVFPEDLLNLKN